MGAVDAQLVGSACDGVEVNEGLAVSRFYYLIECMCLFAVFKVNLLARTVVEVGNER